MGSIAAGHAAHAARAAVVGSTRSTSLSSAPTSPPRRDPGPRGATGMSPASATSVGRRVAPVTGNSCCGHQEADERFHAPASEHLAGQQKSAPMRSL